MDFNFHPILQHNNLLFGLIFILCCSTTINVIIVGLLDKDLFYPFLNLFMHRETINTSTLIYPHNYNIKYFILIFLHY